MKLYPNIRRKKIEPNKKIKKTASRCYNADDHCDWPQYYQSTPRSISGTFDWTDQLQSAASQQALISSSNSTGDAGAKWAIRLCKWLQQALPGIQKLTWALGTLDAVR